MILSKQELLDEVVERYMRYVESGHVNASSIDVTLGLLFLKEEPVMQLCRVELGKREALKLCSHYGEVVLGPGEFTLASTKQVFFMPNHLSAEFRLKSSAGRMGLSHALAVWVDPGFNGSALTLELHNITKCHEIVLKAGDRVGQMIFHRHAPVSAEDSYAARGSYNGDLSAQPARPEKS